MINKTHPAPAERDTILTASTVIDSPLENVWKTIKLPGEIVNFHPLIKRSKQLGTISNGIGAKRSCELIPMGKMIEKAVEWKEKETYTMEVIDGSLLPPYRHMSGKLNIEAVSQSQTKVTFSFRYRLKFGLIGQLIDLVMVRPQFKKAPPKYVNGLKKYVEERSLVDTEPSDFKT